MADTAAFPAGPRPGERDTAFFKDPMIDHLLRAIVTLTMEVSVTRERVRTLEVLLAQGGAIDPAQADQYEPGSEEAADRARQRSKLTEEILGPIVSRLSRDG
ncbi:MAG: hypothetical protein H7268_14070 [Sandarakinorhabdus sp.]|nr:hypothetical protein [Sandarakinorhabdus sp.]